MGSPHPVVRSYRSWGQLCLDLGFRSEVAFSIWAVLGQVRGWRQDLPHHLRKDSAEPEPFSSERVNYPEPRSLKRDCLAHRSLLYQGDGCLWLSTVHTEFCWYPHQWFLLHKGQACLSLNICYHSADIHHCVIYPIFNLFSEENLPSPAPICILLHFLQPSTSLL